MAIGTGADDIEAGAERQLLAEGQPARGKLVELELGLAQRPLQRREQMRQRLLVIPHMGAGSFAGAVLGMLALPAPQLPAFEADDSGRAQQRQGGAGSILDLGGQRGAE